MEEHVPKHLRGTDGLTPCSGAACHTDCDGDVEGRRKRILCPTCQSWCSRVNVTETHRFVDLNDERLVWRDGGIVRGRADEDVLRESGSNQREDDGDKFHGWLVGAEGKVGARGGRTRRD